MAVRTHLSWPWKALLGLLLAGVIGGMWWWGFDFGQLLGGFNRDAIEREMTTLRTQAATAEQEAATLRAHSTQLESDLAMMRGLQGTMTRQMGELQQENAAMKEEISFLQTFFEGSAKPGLALQRLAVTVNGGDVARYSLLVVRGGNPRGDFEGHVTLVAELSPVASGPETGPGLTVSVPEDGGEAPGPLALRFKYYQRLEGTFRVPPGYAVRAVTARAFEAGTPAPRATRTLTLP